jgi:hypothetical protein
VKKWDDVIGRVPIKSPDGPKYGFEVPFGIMVPKEVENLLTASGKSVSTDPVGMIRGISSCMMLGEAAGVAAALGAKQGVSPHAVPIVDIQRQLVAQGAYLGEPDRLKELGIA